MRVQHQQTSPKHSSGVIAVLVLVSMVAMLGMVGLALDGGHGMLNKSRLQNVVDAAALASALELDLSRGDEAVARTEAMRILAANSNELGNDEIAVALAGGDLDVTIEFSNTILPFIAGTSPARYVRVRATGLDLPGWFIPVMGVDEKRIAASAVAGPSPTLERVCNLTPLLACGTPSTTDPYFGYTPGETTVLKTSSGGGDFEVGPGNFQLVRLDGSQGAADLRDALAGGYDQCLTTNSGDIPTEPGNTVGPVAQGLNTRFGTYSGPISPGDYPSDLVRDQIDSLTYENGVVHYEGAPISDDNALPWGQNYYIENMLNSSSWNDYDQDGEPLRRVLRVPVGQCDGTVNGAGDVPLLGVLCFFLLQEVSQHGQESYVFGQFMGADNTCAVTGRPGPEPVSGPGPYRIQLYKDPSWDSA